MSRSSAIAAHVLEDMIRVWQGARRSPTRRALDAVVGADRRLARAQLPAYRQSSKDVIMPQYAIERLYALTKDRDIYITTEVGQHQMWAAQFFSFEEPNRWMTSGGLGTMGYGLPAAIGVQIAHPDSLVIDIAGDASVLMTMQEMSTAVQYRSADQDLHPEQPVHGHGAPVAAAAARQSLFATTTESLPDFVKLAEAYGGVGMRCEKPAELDDAIQEMIDVKRR